MRCRLSGMGMARRSSSAQQSWINGRCDFWRQVHMHQQPSVANRASTAWLRHDFSWWFPIAGSLFICSALALLSASARADDRASGAVTLRQAAKNRMLIGAALSATDLENPKVTQLVANQFDCVTPVNEMK